MSLLEKIEAMDLAYRVESLERRKAFEAEMERRFTPESEWHWLAKAGFSIAMGIAGGVLGGLTVQLARYLVG